ncbi:MAG TPA: HEAT repeat domain-containing protein [Kofleriaceae bacterium]
MRALVVLLLAVTSCAPSACSDEEDRRLGRWVEALVGEPGPRADAAEEALVASGGEAILYLETGLYDAEPRARRRVVKTLARIGDRAALPILDHLARRDPDEAVRNAAGAAEKALEGASAP